MTSYSHFYKATSTTYARRGGHCNRGITCGFVCVSMVDTAPGDIWAYGAALSFKSYIKLRVLHMLDVVDVHGMAFIVASLLFFWPLMLLGMIGIMEPPYHLNQ